MNYRHIYHAGNFADVFKHVVLGILLKQLCLKEKPFCYIDTHAGIGLYDLQADEAQRSFEYQHGIMKLLSIPTLGPEFSDYINIVKSFNNNSTSLECYPGSPFIAKQFLREYDKMILNELHDQDFLTLKKNIRNIQQACCHKRDAYEFLPAILPPTPRRALILIDPPYEKLSEHTQLIHMLKTGLQKFESGIFVLWYPIVDERHHKLLRQIHSSITQPIQHYEIRSQSKKEGLIGSGVVIINPPWNTDTPIQNVVKRLNQIF